MRHDKLQELLTWSEQKKKTDDFKKKWKNQKAGPEAPKEASTCQGGTRQGTVSSDPEAEGKEDMPTASFCSPGAPVSQERTFSAEPRVYSRY